jgi:hypothetical protein
MDKSKLTSKRLETVEVPIDETDSVTIRPLTRQEAFHVVNKEMAIDVAERYVLSRAMVDPEMSEADVKAWQDGSPAGEIQRVFEKVVEISGMSEGAAKAAYKSTS